MNRTANDVNPIYSQALVWGYNPDIDFIVVLQLMVLMLQEGLLDITPLDFGKILQL
jgi:hypothetical protein